MTEKLVQFFIGIKFMFGIVFVLLSIGIDIVIVFSNPDITETRFFSAYLPYFTGSLLGMIFGVILLKL